MNGSRALLKAAFAVLLWIACGALAWWWQLPKTGGDKSTKAAAQDLPLPPPRAADLSQDPLWKQLSERDPFGLRRETPIAAAAPQGAASDTVVWRFAALSVNKGQSQVLLMAPGEEPLLLKQGDKLPNGERIKSIYTDRLEIQDKRGRKRTIQLIEP